MLKKVSHIFNISSEKTKYGEIHSKVLRRIRAKGSLWAFTSGDFSDIGDPYAVGTVLTRLNKKGLINKTPEKSSHTGGFDRSMVSFLAFLKSLGGSFPLPSNPISLDRKILKNRFFRRSFGKLPPVSRISRQRTKP